MKLSLKLYNVEFCAVFDARVDKDISLSLEGELCSLSGFAARRLVD